MIFCMKSIFITGASGVGKSTAYHQLIERGFRPSPNHLTRNKREDEEDGIDAHFIEKEEFKENFHKGIYLESTLAETEYIGVHYGSPRSWRNNIENQATPFVAIPANVMVLRSLCKVLKGKGYQNDFLWMNLHAPIDTRRTRIEQRISDLAILESRLKSGVSHGIQADADLNLDTSVLSPEDVISTVLGHVHE